MLELGLERCRSNIPAFKDALKDPRPGMRIVGVRSLGWLRLCSAQFWRLSCQMNQEVAVGQRRVLRDSGSSSMNAILNALQTESKANIRAALVRALG